MNLNKVFLGGRIANELEIKKTQSGISYLRMSIAVNRPKKKGEEKAVCDFINCTAWSERAEMIFKYFKKGSQILAIGSIQVNTYEKDGKKISNTDVLIDEVQFVDTLKGENRADSGNTHTEYTPNKKNAPNGSTTSENTMSMISNLEPIEEDLPF